jgi:hypothetical protein
MPTLYIRLAAGDSEPSGRAPLLEGLLARAAAPVAIDDWRADAFRTIAVGPVPPPGIAPAALCSVEREVCGAWVCVATAVHLTAGMTQVSMPRNGCLTLNEHEAHALAVDFNRVFSDAGMRLSVGRGAVLLCVFDSVFTVATHDPEDAIGSDVFEFQPEGADAPRLRRLASEMEMWLFDHDINRVRTAQGQLPITGLWLWGGGATLPELPAINGWTAGPDPLFAAFGAICDFPSEPMPGGVLVCTERPGTGTWREVERRWFEPAVMALASGRITQVHLSAGTRRFDVPGGRNWRFWRRARPWWETLSTKDLNGVP